ncbi:hypothetical protein [Aerococcus urinae]|uniref:hypothetical protein n=1 Tax=Aerococcus urinae TaxID=1376 RepID=UPI00254EAC6B|nr:hypothetical protein [Aerococcus urinae]MDK7716067.1 hypothetical protein [Aerococcus urinae]
MGWKDEVKKINNQIKEKAKDVDWKKVGDKSLDITVDAVGKGFELFNKGAAATAKGLTNISADIGYGKAVKCPVCKSKDVEYIGQDKKFSMKRALGGAFLAGEAGAAVGGFSGSGKVRYRCKNCSRTFKHK